MLSLPSDVRLKTRDRTNARFDSHDIHSMVSFHRTSGGMGRNLSGFQFSGNRIGQSLNTGSPVAESTRKSLEIRENAMLIFETVNAFEGDVEKPGHISGTVYNVLDIRPLGKYVSGRTVAETKDRVNNKRKVKHHKRKEQYSRKDAFENDMDVIDRHRLPISPEYTSKYTIDLPEELKNKKNNAVSSKKRRKMSLMDIHTVDASMFMQRNRRMSEIDHKQVKRLSDIVKTGGGLGAISRWKFKVKQKKQSGLALLQDAGLQLEPKVPPLQRFRNYMRVALICVRLCRNSLENLKAHRGEYLSIIQITQDYVKPLSDHDGVFFDPTLYRANKEKRFPADAKRVLQKYQNFRTQKELDYVHLVLRNIQAFAEYPTKMQKQLVRVGWYEVFEPKRAIVRQGQSPLAFYIILSGSVVVTSYDRKSETTTFLVALHRGMSFGELAVINKSRRQASVSTATVTEFLCISAKDFVEIFMSGGIKSVTDPDQNSFIRSIPFLKYWPIECLATNPGACMFHFFGRGQVIVRDSIHSDWIYIVKSGSLSVLKKLTEVKPRDTRRKSDPDSDEQEATEANEADDDDMVESDDGSPGNNPRSKGSFGTWNFRIKKKKRRDSTLEKEVFKNNIEMEKRLEQTLPGYFNAADRLAIIDYDEIITDHRSRVLQSSRRMSMADGPSQPPKITVATESPIPESPEHSATGDTLNPEEEDKMVKLPKIRKTSKGAYLASTKTSKRKATRKEAIQEELFQKQMEYDKKLLDDRKIGRKTITDDLDNKLIKDFTLTEKDIRPMFVLVQILERGQHFGLTKSVFPEQAESFSIVSNGAECIMISKKFFLEKATEQTMLHLRQVETLLPNEDELQTDLQDLVDWKAHRAKVYNRLVRNRVDRTVRHSQFPPQYSGQYNFRTGPFVRLSDF